MLAQEVLQREVFSLVSHLSSSFDHVCRETEASVTREASGV
jgi:hypothetical protein